MKKIILFFMLAAITIVACHDDPELQTNDLIGKWKLIKTSGTLHGNGIETDWNRLEITASKAIFYNNITKMEEATYNLDTKDSTIQFVFDNKTAIVGDLKSDPEKFFSLKNNKSELDLVSDCCDRVNYELKAE